MATLNGIVLNPNMEWVDRAQANLVFQTVKYTLGGAPVVYNQQKIGTRPITLQATADAGWLQSSVVDALMVLAQIPGGVFPFLYGSESYSVMFRHHEPPALDFRPFVPRELHDATDYFIGTIKLMTV